MDVNTKNVMVLTKPGLDLTAPAACRGCVHLTERRFCRIWAFPESKWKRRLPCPDYSVYHRGPDLE